MERNCHDVLFDLSNDYEVTQLMQSSEWKNSFTRRSSLPVVLGLGNDARPVAVDISALSSLVIIGGDSLDQDYFLHTLFCSIGLGQREDAFEMQIYNGMSFCSTLHFFGKVLGLSCISSYDEFSGSQDEYLDWIGSVCDFMDRLEMEVAVRIKIIRASGSNNFAEYIDAGNQMPRKIVFVRTGEGDSKLLYARIHQIMTQRLADAGVLMVFISLESDRYCDGVFKNELKCGRNDFGAVFCGMNLYCATKRLCVGIEDAAALYYYAPSVGVRLVEKVMTLHEGAERLMKDRYAD